MSVDLPESSSYRPALIHLNVDDVQPDPRNPRLIFPEVELERLAESISEAGVLVPIVVYQEGERYNLIDGERRLICSRSLGLPTIPAVVVTKPNEVTRLTHMFNIHLVREQWQDMPTAWALEQYISATGVDNDQELGDSLGLSVERVLRLRHALELPKEYQEYIYEGKIPINFFWELKKNLIDPLAKFRPQLSAEFGKGEILSSFVSKRLAGVVTDVVSLRKISPIIRAARDESESTGEAETEFDSVLRNLIQRQEVTIDEAYEETVAAQVEFSKLSRRADTVVRTFGRALKVASTAARRDSVRAIVLSLATRLSEIVK